MTAMHTLKKCSLFSRMKDDQLERIIPLCTSVAVTGDTILFKQGQVAKHLYVVQEGRAALELSVAASQSGGQARPRIVATLNVGEAFGWSAVVEPHVMTLSASSVGAGRFLLIDGPALKELLGRDRNLGYSFMTALCGLLSERLMQTRATLIYERGWAVGV